MCLGNKQLGRVWFLLVNHAVREVKTVRSTAAAGPRTHGDEVGWMEA
jgi:hypothetical protein